MTVEVNMRTDSLVFRAVPDNKVSAKEYLCTIAKADLVARLPALLGSKPILATLSIDTMDHLLSLCTVITVDYRKGGAMDEWTQPEHGGEAKEEERKEEEEKSGADESFRIRLRSNPAPAPKSAAEVRRTGLLRARAAVVKALQESLEDFANRNFKSAWKSLDTAALTVISCAPRRYDDFIKDDFTIKVNRAHLDVKIEKE